MADNSTTTSFVQLTSSNAFCNFGLFVFRKEALHALKHPIFRRVGKRTIKEEEPLASLFEFFDQKFLVDISPSQTIGGMNQYAIKGPGGGIVAQSIQRWAREDAAGPAIIDVTVYDLMVLLLSVLVEGGDLRLNCLLLLLFLSGNTSIESDSHEERIG